MKPKDTIIKAFKREIQLERGLKITIPNIDLVKAHADKADHNLIVMTDLDKLSHSDWVVITAYYSMYHSAMAVLSKIGLDSKDHATTVAVLEYFFGKKIEKSLLDRFNELKEKKDKLETVKIEEKYINYLWKTKKTRETMQYGISITYKETDIIINNTREFVTKIKLLLEDINEDFVNISVEELKALWNSAKLRFT